MEITALLIRSSHLLREESAGSAKSVTFCEDLRSFRSEILHERVAQIRVHCITVSVNNPPVLMPGSPREPRMKKLVAQPVADALHAETKERVHHYLAKYGRPPKLVVVLVGDHPASVIYTRRKGKIAVSLGMQNETIKLAATVSPETVKAVVEQLNRDARVDGILIQRPLPSSFKEEDVLFWI